MKPLRLDQVREILPALDELQPVMDLLVSRSEPDSRRTWTRSGELDTLGDRLISGDALSASALELAAREAAHLQRLYGLAAEAVRKLEAAK